MLVQALSSAQTLDFPILCGKVRAIVTTLRVSGPKRRTLNHEIAAYDKPKRKAAKATLIRNL